MTKRFFSALSFNVFDLSIKVWDYPVHRHTFYELIFVIKGTGQHLVNDHKYAYSKGDVFLLTPEDIHSFKIESETTFGFLKFTEPFLQERTNDTGQLHWKAKVLSIIEHAHKVSGSIITDSSDRNLMLGVFEVLKREYKFPKKNSRIISMELFSVIMSVIERNIKTDKLTVDVMKNMTEQDRVNELLAYLRLHVLDKEKMKISEIAKVFLMSENYVSVFIKKHIGLSIQQYIMQTKMKMAERLLRQSGLTISEISNKMGYTDSSHFNKAFRKSYGVSPKKFRRSPTK